MTQPLPARAGDPIERIDTPALVLDLDVFEANLRRMAETASRLGVALRPHAKSHKCAEIARRQIAAGAVGVCVQKVSEAEALAAEGIRDILICNELVTARKVEALVRSNRHARVSSCVDDPAMVDLHARLAAEAGIVLPLLIEVDVGHGRCGIAPGPALAELARRIVAAPSLTFAGVHAYHGRAQHIRGVAERRATTRSAVERAAQARDLLAAAGIACPVITGAGTGSFEVEGASGVYTEIQPGSYVFMDADYQRNEWAEPPFRQSLFVLTGVMSRTVPEGESTRRQAIVDAGLKALAFDSGVPEIARRESRAGGFASLPGSDQPDGLTYTNPSDEHGTLAVADGVAVPRLGDRLWLTPGHCDPTVNLYDWIVAIRGERVEDVWPITARGCLG